ncbi:hypothetical protein MCY_01730, partial [Bartonella rattimassiliensis 15908]
RGMIEKEKRGELYLERSLFALVKHPDQQEVNSLDLEKKHKTNQEEKSSLLKSELKEVLKTLNRSINSKKFV